jgi:hypothetical protein
MTIEQAGEQLRSMLDDAAAAGAPGAPVTYLPPFGPSECGPTPMSEGGPVNVDEAIDITVDGPGAGREVAERIAEHWRDEGYEVDDMNRVDDIAEYGARKDGFVFGLVANLADPVVRVMGTSPCVVEP